MASTIRLNSRRPAGGEKAKLLADIARLNDEARENWDDDAWRKETAAEITSTIYEGFMSMNALDLMLTTEDVGWSDRVTVSEVRGLQAFWVARGAYVGMSRLRKETAELPRDTLAIHVGDFEDKMMSGFTEASQDIVTMAIERFRSEQNRRIVSLLQSAVSSVVNPTSFINGAFSLTAVRTAIRQVRDKAKGAPVVVIGREAALGRIPDALTNASGQHVGFTPETNEDLLLRGVMGNYNGARLISIPTYDDEVDYLPEDEIFVLAKNCGKAARFGGMRAKEWTENEVDYWHYRAWQDMGAMLTHPTRIRRFKITG